MTTIHQSHPIHSHPVRHIALNELNRHKDDLSLPGPTALAAKDAELGKMVFSPAWSDPMMIKEAVNSPRHRGEMNHSKHHYRLFWTCLRSLPQPALREAERREDLLRGEWP